MPIALSKISLLFIWSAPSEDNFITFTPLQQLCVFELTSVDAIDAFHLKEELFFTSSIASFTHRWALFKRALVSVQPEWTSVRGSVHIYCPWVLTLQLATVSTSKKPRLAKPVYVHPNHPTSPRSSEVGCSHNVVAVGFNTRTLNVKVLNPPHESKKVRIGMSLLRCFAGRVVEMPRIECFGISGLRILPTVALDMRASFALRLSS